MNLCVSGIDGQLLEFDERPLVLWSPLQQETILSSQVLP